MLLVMSLTRFRSAGVIGVMCLRKADFEQIPECSQGELAPFPVDTVGKVDTMARMGSRNASRRPGRFSEQFSFLGIRHLTS